MDLRAVVKNVIYNCLGYKKGEELLIVTDDKLFRVANDFYCSCLKLGIDLVLAKYESRKMHGEEPPSLIAKLMKDADLVLLFTYRSLSHTIARKQASKKGVRIASLPGITHDIVLRTLGIDYRKLKSKVERIAQKLTHASEVVITTAQGTELYFSIKGRKGFADTGIYRDKASFGNLPAGEACIAPLEGTAEGKIVFDASFAGIGKLEVPINVIVSNGYVTEISSPKLKKILAPYGKKALNIAEFGIGLNPQAEVRGNVLEDEKALNTAHIALGSNISFGGRIKAGIHLDGVFYKPQIWLDGKKLRLYE